MICEVSFRGHDCIRSNHERTVEVTTGSDLTPAGDCILGVGASAGCAGLPAGIREALRRPGARVRCTFEAGGHSFTVSGHGDPGLVLSDPHDIVLRRSSFICPRTMAVRCDKASDMAPRGLVRALREPGAAGRLVISVD